jgi:hypothetical protein
MKPTPSAYLEACSNVIERLRVFLFPKARKDSTELASGSFNDQKHNPEEEYKEVSANLRHYHNMQFAEMTVLVAITAGLITLLCKSDPPISLNLQHLICIGGIVVAILFWMMEESAIYMWTHFAKRAAQIEDKIGYKQYRNLPGAPNFRYLFTLRPGSLGVRLMCIAFLAFWIFA